MSQSENVGSGWDLMLTAIINSIKSKKVLSFHGDHELDAIQKIFNISAFRQLTSDWISSLSESNNVSLENTNQFRAIGNELYKNMKRNGMRVVDCYTRAIFSAPIDSGELLGMAHANRAAALIALDYHKEAYFDCKLARQHSYPKSKLIKVLWRQATCSMKLQNLDQLINDLNEIDGILDELKIRHLHEDKRQHFSVECETLKANINGSDSKTTGAVTDRILIEKQNSHKGRFMVSSKKIETNELIINEKAFAFIPVYQKFDGNPIDLHCQNCAATNIIPFPCNQCKRASYCGISCLNEHMENIHRFECSGYKKHLWYEIGIAHLALRTMLCGIKDLIAKIQHLCDATPLLAWNELFLAAEESNFAYGSVLKLVTNFDETDENDFLGYVLTATMITTYLSNHTPFFDELTENFPKLMPNSSWKVFIGAIITRHIGQLICNGHAISDFEIAHLEYFESANRIAKGKLSQAIESQRIFTAIFPRISMFNHSCSPNIRNKFNNNELMVHASRDIADGDEILNCYGPNSKLHERKDRKDVLKQQYHFKCDCLSCSGQDEDYLNSHAYLCPCGADLLIISSQKFWWRNCTKDGPPDKMICSNCSNQMKFDWLLEFRECIQQLDSEFDNFGFAAQTEETMLKSIVKYENAVNFMKGDISSQKLDMANMLLKYVIHYLNLPNFNMNNQVTEIYERIKKICLSSLNGCEYKFGRYSFEYVSSLAMFMDISAIYNRPEEDLIDLNVFENLSDRTKKIFVNYFEAFVRNSGHGH